MAPQAAKFHQEANRYDELAQNATTERMRGHLLRLAHHYRSIAEGLQPLLEAPPVPERQVPPRAADPVVPLRRAPAPAASARVPRAAAPPPAREPPARATFDREQRLRERAYAIWEGEGRPHGRDRDHWFAAERELAAGA